MNLNRKQVQFRKFLVALLGIALFIGGMFMFATHVNQNDYAKELVSSLGYVGVFISATVAGFNVFFPAPATALTPIFLEAGLHFPYIIAALILGTLFADMLGYLLGHLGKHVTEHVHPRLYANLKTFDSRHHRLVLPGVFLFAALVPLPNELLLIPLGLIGYKFRYLIIPLLVGTIVHQIIYAYSFMNLFKSIT